MQGSGRWLCSSGVGRDKGGCYFFVFCQLPGSISCHIPTYSTCGSQMFPQEAELHFKILHSLKTISYLLCPASLILKTVRISRFLKIQALYCSKKKASLLNINVINPSLLLACCTHLHSGFAKKNNCKNSTIVKHVQTHTRLSLI